VSLRVELSTSPQIRLEGMFVWKLESPTPDRRFGVVAVAKFPALSFTITGAFQWPSAFGWKGFDATVHVAISVGTDVILGGGFKLTMGNKVLDFKLYVPFSVPLALVMYVEMLNFDLGNMARWYNENSGACPSSLTCISEASIQSLDSINIAHIEFYYAGRSLTVPIPVGDPMVLQDKTFSPGFSFTADATIWQVGIQLSLGMVQSDTLPSFWFSFSLKNLDIPAMLRQAFDQLTAIFGGSGVENMESGITKTTLQGLLNAIEFIVPRIDNLEILNFNSASLSGGGKGPTFRFQGKWLGMDFDINFETELGGFSNSLLDTIKDYFTALLPECFINSQCSGTTPMCSHTPVSTGNPKGWQCVKECDAATESDLGNGVGCWPKKKSGTVCLQNNQCFSGDCSGSFSCTADCPCNSAAVSRGPCNSDQTDCLPCADPASNQFPIKHNDVVKCHACDASHAANGHALCESQGNGGKYCDDSGNSHMCTDCDSTCKACDGGGSADCTSCATTEDNRYSYKGTVTGSYCVSCVTNSHCSESEYCDNGNRALDPGNNKCKACIADDAYCGTVHCSTDSLPGAVHTCCSGDSYFSWPRRYCSTSAP